MERKGRKELRLIKKTRAQRHTALKASLINCKDDDFQSRNLKMKSSYRLTNAGIRVFVRVSFRLRNAHCELEFDHPLVTFRSVVPAARLLNRRDQFLCLGKYLRYDDKILLKQSSLSQVSPPPRVAC